MKNIKINYLKIIILTAIISIVSVSCERNLADDATLSTNSKNGEVFIDGFSAGLGYGAFGGSKYTAFTVDTEVKYEGTASMRFDVPSVGDPNGTYAGGVFIDGSGRNLTDFDALTFWVKGSQAATINSVGFGTDFGLNKYNVAMNNVSIGTNWQKVIIPMPDSSVLKQEQGMFWYAEGPENGLGYSFWMDNVKYERLGTIAHQIPSILNGIDKVEQTFIGSAIALSGLTDTFNMPSGFNQTVTLAPSYFKFTSSNTAVATVNELGLVSVVGSGTCDIKATMSGIPATGSLKIKSLGVFTPAPTPTQNAANVISIFSNAYQNIPVEYYNGYWMGSTTLGTNDLQINGNDIIKYTQLNYVGIQFAQPTVNVSQMTNLRIDIKVQNTNGSRNSINIKLVDFGSDGSYGGGNDTSHELVVTNANFSSGSWVSLDLPLSSFTGLTNKSNLAQLILGPSTSGITDLLVDNIYFYTVPTAPTIAAPTPSLPAANVISVFSDAYTNIAANLNPGWGQATVVTQPVIAGNNTLKYTGLNYQGIEFGAIQNISTMTKLHIDYFSTNSTSLKTYLINPGPVEKAKVLTVPTAAGWNSLEISLTDFSPVNLANVFQMKFDGNGTIYLDNIYFHN